MLCGVSWLVYLFFVIIVVDAACVVVLLLLGGVVAVYCCSCYICVNLFVECCVALIACFTCFGISDVAVYVVVVFVVVGLVLRSIVARVRCVLNCLYVVVLCLLFVLLAFCYKRC